MLGQLASILRGSLLASLSLGAFVGAVLAPVGATGCVTYQCLAACVETLSISGAFDVPATTGPLVIEICVGESCEEVPLDPEPVGGSVASVSSGGTADQPGVEMHYFLCNSTGNLSCHVENGRLRISGDLAIGGHELAVGDVVELIIRPVRSEEPVIAASMPVVVIGVNEVCGTKCDAVGLTWD